MPREPLLARHAAQVGNHRPREIERPRMRVEHHLRRIGILQRSESVFGREGPDERGDVGPGVVEAAHQGLELRGTDEGLVALHVHHRVERPADQVVSLPAAVRAAPMVGGGHHHPPAEGEHRLADALVVRGHRHVVQHPCYLFVNPPDDGFAAQQGQRLPGKARRGVARRDDCDEFHGSIRSARALRCRFVSFASASSYDLRTISSSTPSGTSLSKRTLIQCRLSMCHPGPTPS